jgi:hypothetical protein
LGRLEERKREVETLPQENGKALPINGISEKKGGWGVWGGTF